MYLFERFRSQGMRLAQAETPDHVRVVMPGETEGLLITLDAARWMIEQLEATRGVRWWPGTSAAVDFDDSEAGDYVG